MRGSVSVRFEVLGHVNIVHDGHTLTLKKSKVSQTLALLMTRANGTVSVDMLIDDLWESRPPNSVQTTLQTYIYHARRMFDRLGCPDSKETLVTRPPGYMLVAPEGTFDSHSFRQLVTSGERCLERDEVQQAAKYLSAANKLWRGHPFAGIPTGPMIDAHVTYLEELRLTAVSHLIEAQQRLGRHQALIPELRLLVLEHPLNESFHSLLIRALHRCGRHAEALQAYQKLWRILDAELGVRPGRDVQELYEAIVAAPT
jgi:SARP family transcriptional regulator, regulator of embCAB operon